VCEQSDWTDAKENEKKLIALFVGIGLGLLYMIFIRTEMYDSMKGILMPERLSTPKTIEKILSKWKKHAGKEKSTGLIPLPGPIPKQLLLSSCDNSVDVEKCNLNNENTINKYREAFGAFSSPAITLDDEHCITIINNVEAKLSNPYGAEVSADMKSNICRVAALYLYGGYYFDSDLETLNAFIPSETVTFTSAIEEPETGFFQAFMATTTHHPILEHALQMMVQYYDKAYKTYTYNTDDKEDEEKDKDLEDGRFMLDDMNGFTAHDNENQIPGYINLTYVDTLTKEDPSWHMGTRTLKNAFATMSAKAQGETYIIHEILLDKNGHQNWYPELERRISEKCCCNFAVHDPGTKKVHFWSHRRGTVFC